MTLQIRTFPSSASAIAALTTLTLLGACAAPNPGVNPAASAVQAPPDVKLATKPTTGQEVGAVVQNSVRISFVAGGTALTPDANKQLDLAARLFRDVNPVAMYVAGHTDPSGNEYGNVLLSARRAQVVKQALVARGIGADRLLIQAYGASQPADGTDPNSPENRRAVITWRLL